MPAERTLAIIKPDAVVRGITGRIITRIEEEGFSIRAMKKLRVSAEEAARFYAAHRGKSCFRSLIEGLAGGPVVVLCLEREDAVAKWLEVIGAPNPASAADGTIRKLYAVDEERNSVHGSGGPETAAVETAFFFCGLELGS